MADVLANPFGEGRTIAFYGRSDVGKTFLARAVLNELGWDAWGFCSKCGEILRGGALLKVDARFRGWRKVAATIYGGGFDIVDDLEEYRMLVLDDIGAEHDPRRIATAALDRVIRSRQRKWTLVTFNCDPNAVDNRVASFLSRDRNVMIDMDTTEYSSR